MEAMQRHLADLRVAIASQPGLPVFNRDNPIDRHSAGVGRDEIPCPHPLVCQKNPVDGAHGENSDDQRPSQPRTVLDLSAVDLRQHEPGVQPPFTDATAWLHDKSDPLRLPSVDLDSVFKALSDPTRRRLLDELDERDGQTLFELHVRLTSWHGAGLTRQGLSKHLRALEEAGLVRTEWRWRSKHHFLEREPLRRLWRVWLGPLVEPSSSGGSVEDRRNEHPGR